MYSGRVSRSSSMCGTRLLRQNVPYASYSLNENIFTQNVAPGWAYMVRLEFKLAENKGINFLLTRRASCVLDSPHHDLCFLESYYPQQKNEATVLPRSPLEGISLCISI